MSLDILSGLHMVTADHLVGFPIVSDLLVLKRIPASLIAAATGLSALLSDKEQILYQNYYFASDSTLACRYEFPSEFAEALDHGLSSGKDTKVMLRMVPVSTDTAEAIQ